MALVSEFYTTKESYKLLSPTIYISIFYLTVNICELDQSYLLYYLFLHVSGFSRENRTNRTDRELNRYI